MKVPAGATATLLVMILLVTAVGCAAPRSSAPPPPGSSGKVGAMPEPGITELGGGRVVANGWVTEVDLESGFWAIDSLPPTSSANHTTVAVLLPGKVTAEQLANVRGTFVGAEGVLQQGASIRMAGPEIVVDALRVY